MSGLPGTPSDELPAVLDLGRSGTSTVYVSMSARHPEGRDAEYLEWHTLDHRVEQYRLPHTRSSLRVVSTPACRKARAASDERFDAADHVMTYWFAGPSGLQPFYDLAPPLQEAGRIPPLLPTVARGAFGIEGRTASPRIRVGADVLPWWPTAGVYLLVERGHAPADELVEVPGVGGAWWGRATPEDPMFDPADDGLQLTYCFLDGDPVETAGRLRPALDRRWREGSLVPLLAAPFHTVVAYQWSAHLPG